MIEFRMPSLGADMEAGTLREWKVMPGDMVKRGDIIALVETQKGLIEIEIFEEGKIESLLLKEEDKVPVGTIMATVIVAGDDTQKKTEEKKATTFPAKNVLNEKSNVQKLHTAIKASPLAKSIAEKYGIDLARVKGSGEGGAITKDDVEKANAEQHFLQETDPAASNESIRMAVAAAMSKSNREIPHYYLELKVDMTKALSRLAELNKNRPLKDRLLPVVLLIKAVAKSLLEIPALNAVWDNGLQKKTEINVGFVIALRSGGLMVPAIHYADKKSIDEIMQALNDIIPRARNLKLRSSELSDATITITNLGNDGADKVYGVIYPPQVAIIGFGSITEQPWAESGMLDVRPLLTITLAGDHRATDGHTGSLFLAAVKNHLQNPEYL